jgi:hypothetical protein
MQLEKNKDFLAREFYVGIIHIHVNTPLVTMIGSLLLKSIYFTNAVRKKQGFYWS